ncbi:MAG: Rieske 2Fe-2S domain-containing protein [Myxococcota bacterium]
MSRFPFGIARGWYLLAYAGELARETVLSLERLGRSLVVFRGASGAVHVLDAHCPHLGAHLGIGGRVVSDTIQCPFHGWRFDGEGRCREIPYAKRIPNGAQIRSHPVAERNGMIFVWYDSGDGPPDFEIPHVAEWGDPEWLGEWLSFEWTVRTHPQEMGENGIDWPHFETIHRIPAPSDRRWEFREHAYCWQVGGTKPASALASGRDEILMYGENWGLGYSWLRQRGHYETIVATGMTPIDAETTHVRMGVLGRIGHSPSPAARAAFEAYMKEHALFAEADFPIWENKRYRERPLLCDGDGPIAEYRRWAARFHSSSKPGAPTEA